MSSQNQPTIAILGRKGEIKERWLTPFIERGIAIKFIEPDRNLNAQEALAGVSGLFLTGGNSNIHPRFVNRSIPPEGDLYEEDRDLAAFELIKHALDIDLPTLGICRGMQEMVATFGGALEKLDNKKHGANYAYEGNHEKMDKVVHPITPTKDGILDALLRPLCSRTRSIMVNSIHHEGITFKGWCSKQSAELRKIFNIEAKADDGVIEAISAKEKTFFIGVQAHFEFKGKLHDALFNAFEKNILLFHSKANAKIDQSETAPNANRL